MVVVLFHKLIWGNKQRAKKHQQKVKLNESVKKGQDAFGSYFVTNQQESKATPGGEGAMTLNIPEPPPPAPVTSKDKTARSQATTSVSQMANKADVLNAEVLWALKCLTSILHKEVVRELIKYLKTCFPTVR